MRYILALLFALVSVSVLATPVPAHATWTVADQKDPMTDEVTTVASVMLFNAQAYTLPTAVVMCRPDGTIGVVISTGDILDGPGFVPLRYRIDDQPAKDAQAMVLRDSLYAGIHVGAVELAKSLQHGETLLVEITKYNGLPSTRKYPLIGSRAAIGVVLRTCGY